MADHMYTYDDPPSERDLDRIVRTLEDSGVIAYSNEVNWSFGCDAASPKALARMHRLKPRPSKEQTFTLVCSSISMASEVGVIDNSAYRMLKRAWPGPFTVLVPVSRSLPKQIRDKRRVVGLRIPAAPLVRATIERLGRPLAVSSVPPEESDLHGPKFGYEVDEKFGHALDLVVDLGQEVPGTESTIVDLTTDIPELIREGAGDPKIFDLGS